LLGLLGAIASAFTPAITVADARPLRPIVVIVMENKTFASITNANRALTPYINCGKGFKRTGLICSGKEFKNYFSITAAASLPDYLAMTSGGTNGCMTDGCPPNSMKVDNIFHQLRSRSFRVASFQESMPRNCDEDATGGFDHLYVRKHDPEVFYTDNQPGGAESAPCGSNAMPYSKLRPTHLPSFSFVTPNLCHDMHGTGSSKPCPGGTNAIISAGDHWLARNVPPLISAGARIFVTWDEGTASDAHVLTVEVGRGIKAGRVDTNRYTHYSLLAGLERYFRLPKLQRAKYATPLPI
jgi:hypothetical protein